jgi:ribonuclease-3
VDFETLQQRLHYRFADLDLLERALTHRSVGGGNNERLEFLGDGVLNFVIAEEVFRRRPVATEGELSRLRANLVNKPSLASLARDLGLGEQVRLGTGELKSGGHRRDSILADGLEAIFGAVYLDGGFAAAQEVITRVYRDRLADLPDLDQLKDPKTRLQEHLQAGGMPLPDYEVVEVTGQAHAQVFRVSCRIADVEAVTLGEAGSRRKAEQAAAQAMLQRLAGERSE